VPEPIRIRALARAGVTDIHVLMPHPMETGFRKDADGVYVPAHYITEVEIDVGGKIVLRARLSRAVSEDPLLYFRIREGAPGDPIRATWIDTRGERRTDAATIVGAS
jgi:sulfur-oxidizing protein SoxZ